MAIAGLCYNGNLVDALILAEQNEQCVGNAYNISDGSKISWKKYIDSICGMIGKKSVKVSTPYPVAYGTGMLMETIWRICGFTNRPLLTMMATALVGTHQSFSIEKACSEMGHNPKIDFTEGIRLTGEWLKELGYPVR